MSRNTRPRRRILAGLAPTSRVRSDGGWVWLETNPSSVRLRGALLLLPTATAIAVLRLAAGELPPWLAVVEVVLLLTLSGLVFVRLYKPVSARVGAATIGITLQHGVRAETFAWDAVASVRVDTGARALVVVELDEGHRYSATTYTAGEATSWIRHAAALAPEHVRWPNRFGPKADATGEHELR